MGRQYDIVFLGGGPAGYQGAIRAAQLGARVAVIEEKFVGGVCLNWGCIPTKAVRASAEVGRTLRRAREFGFQPAEAVPDMTALLARKGRIVNALRGSVERLFQARKIDLIEGRGALVGPGRIEVRKADEADLVEGAKVVIATGSRPAGLPVFPKHPRIFLADEMLDISYLPAHLLVVGGGAVGVEMAAIFRELGAEVTLVEAMDSILPTDDREMAGMLLTLLKRRRIRVHSGTTVESVTEKGAGFRVLLSNGAEVAPDTILQAVGRRPNTEEMGLEELGIAMERGCILANRHMETNLPGHYAAGDVVGGWLLAHIAFAEGICAAEHALGMEESWMNYRTVPRCVFSIPEYAAVGCSEEEAQQRACPVKVARFPFRSLAMAQATGDFEGQVKIIAHGESGRILGAHILGPHGADLIAELALAMKEGLPVRSIMDTIHTHPTLSEAVLEAAQALYGQAIHGASRGNAS